MQLDKLIAACGAALLLATLPTPSVSAESGCIVRDPAGAWFKHTDSGDKQTQGKAALDAANVRNARVLEPCLSGVGPKIPEAGYASLAKKRPDLFKQLDDTTSRASRAHSAARTARIQPDYQYISLDELFASEYEFGVEPVGLDNAGRLIGSGFYFVGEDFHMDVVFVKDKKIVAKSKDAFVNVANGKGTGGGAVVTDPVFFHTQAALFRRSGNEVIPRRPGEVTGQVISVTDDDVALVASMDASFNTTFWIYSHGNWAAVHLEDIGYPVFTLSLTNRGFIVGNVYYAIGQDGSITWRAYRLDPTTGKLDIYQPVFEGDTHTFVVEANKHDELVGWSYIPGSTEHVGVWSKEGRFTNYFTQGSEAYPTISNNLEFSDDDQILIYDISRPPSEVGNIYVVPRKGVRFNLLDSLDGMPAEVSTSLWRMFINNRGDMAGNSFFGYHFLIERKSHSQSSP